MAFDRVPLDSQCLMEATYSNRPRSQTASRTPLFEAQSHWSFGEALVENGGKMVSMVSTLRDQLT